MQPTALSETGVFETGAFETGAFAAFEPIDFRLDSFPAVQTVRTRPAAPARKTLTRTLLRKWDMIAVIALMLTGAVYGVYAVFFLTGF